jgi:chromosomal replication initiation ATPase DnaA
MSFPISVQLLPGVNHIISQASQQIKELVGFPVDLRLIIKTDDVNEHFLQSIICDYFNIPWCTIQGKIRKREIVTARQMYCYLCKIYLHTKKPLREIGEEIGGRDHTTVINSIAVIRDHLDTNDPIVTSAFHSLMNIIQEQQERRELQNKANTKAA